VTTVKNKTLKSQSATRKVNGRGEPASTMDETFDVIVIGSGAGGLTAAVTSASEGLRVLLLEKTGYVGGTTAISGGASWLPNNHHAAEVGCSDSDDAVITYLRQFLGNKIKIDMIRSFLKHAPKVAAYLEARTELRFAARALSPDYRPDLPGAALGGRVLDPVEFDGRKLGKRFKDIRPPLPEYTAFNGMMVSRVDAAALLGALKSFSNFRHSAHLILRYLVDRMTYGRGTRLLLGNALVGHLFKSALDLGVDVRTNADVQGLIQHQGRVIGVTFEHAGRTIRAAADAGIVLATGGFPGNAALRATHVPFSDQHFSVPPATNDGGGAAIARGVGGWVDEDSINHYFFSPVSVMTRADGSRAIFPHLVLDRQKPGVIAVNAEGKRFTNEANSYHDFVEAMQSEKAVPAYLICDSRFLRRYGLGVIHPGPRLLGKYLRSGYLTKANSIAELAERLGVDARNLENAVSRNNQFASTGVDLDFGRGSNAYHRFLGDADHKPNPCIGPIDHPPYYAVKIFPGDIGSATGIAVGPEGQVLDKAGAAIEGLYACGNDMHSIFAGTYPGPGTTIGPALAFGYAVAMKLRDQKHQEGAPR
jgi:succinate dehydrogenase/fumarate reductase flavoprotein subunit